MSWKIPVRLVPRTAPSCLIAVIIAAVELGEVNGVSITSILALASSHRHVADLLVG
jgi:hypothetical protein